MDLPRELRDSIYENVFTPETGEVISIDKHSAYRPQSRAVQPAITRLSRQIRKETLPMFYALSSFELRLDGVTLHQSTEVLKKWIEAIGAENARRITNLKVHYIVYLGQSREMTFSALTLDAACGLAEEAVSFRRELNHHVRCCFGMGKYE